MDNLAQFLVSDAGAYAIIGFITVTFLVLIGISVKSPDPEAVKPALYDEEDAA